MTTWENCSFTSNSEKGKTMQTPNKRMKTQRVVFPYNGILLSNKKDWTTDAPTNTDKS